MLGKLCKEKIVALVLGYDTETTGVDTKKDYVLEIGAAIYDTDTKQIFEPFDKLILWPSRPLISPKIEKLTGINEKAIEKWGISPEEAFSQLFRLADKCEYIVAHNEPFDKGITETAILRSHDPSDTLKKKFYGYKWINTLTDLPFPEDLPSKKLKYCAMEHGYIMSTAHRAIFDVFACLHLLKCYEWNQVLEINSSPMTLQTVKCEWHETEKQAELKSAGFLWDKPTKSWQRLERKYFTDKRKNQLSFCIPETISPQNSSGQSLYDLAHPQAST
jgi:DNA polymerase III epsilon subunit-like protein